MHPSNGRAPALYDPGLVGKLGLLFTPAFAAWFSMRNWQALGEEAEAARQKRWFLAGIVFVAGSVALGYSRFAVAELLFNLAFLAFLFLWYFGPQKKQREHVDARFRDAYPTRSLLVPAILAAVVCVAVLASMVGSAMEKANDMLADLGIVVEDAMKGAEPEADSEAD